MILDTIAVGLPVLGEKNQGCSVGRLDGQQQSQEDERVGIWLDSPRREDIEGNPHQDDDRHPGDEGPGADEPGDPFRYATKALGVVTGANAAGRLDGLVDGAVTAATGASHRMLPGLMAHR